MAEYSIRINGVEESINNVKQLIEQLNNLEASISTLENKSIKVNVEGVVQTAVTTSTTSSGSRTSELQQEDALLKQIAQTEEKIATARREEYKDLIQQKDVLKEVTSDAKERAAAERLAGEGYANTMRGLKAELKDIKTVMQTTDLGSDKFRELTTRANTLTQKLKDIEFSYGTFSRDVGNYAQGVAAGMSGLTLQVAGVTREFDNAKQALMALKKERDTLAVKQDQGLVLSEEELQRFRELVQLVPKLQSAIQDAGKPMDNLMDTMESFVALASAGKGLSAFFGLDGGEIDKTIKELLALQNALKGIQTLQKQMQSMEGIGKWFKTGSDAIDKFTSKLFGLDKAQKAAQASATAQATATRGVAAAEGAAATGAATATAANGALTTSMGVATTAAHALGFALKTIGIGLILTAIAALVEGIQWVGEKIADSFKTAEKEAEALNNTLESLRSTYAELLTYNNDMYGDKSLSYNDYFLRQLKLINEELEKEIRLRRQLDEDAPTQYGQIITSGTVIDGSVINNVNDLKEAWFKLNEAVKAGKDYFSMWGKGFADWNSSLWTTVGDTQDAVDKAGEAILNDFTGRVKKVMNELEKAQEDVRRGVDGAATRVENAKRKVKELHDEIYNTTGRSIIDVLNSIKDEEVRNKFQRIIDIIKALRNEFRGDEEDVKKFWHSISLDMLPPMEKALQQAQDKYDEYKKQYGRTAEEIAKLDKWLANEQEKIRKEYSKKNAAANKKELEDAQKQQAELNRMRIANMKEGLNKVIKQLEEERRQKLEKTKKNSELELEINKYYDKKIEDARKKHAEEMVKIEADMWNAIYDMSITNYQKMAQLAEQNANIEMNVFERQTTRDIYESSIGSSTYGIQGKNTYSPKTQGKLGIVSTQNDEMTNDYKKFIDMMREVETEVNKMKKTIVEADAEIAEAEEAFRKNNGMLEKEDLEELRKYYEKRKEDAANHVWGLLEIAKDYEYKLINKYSSIEDAEKASTVMQALIEENYSKSLDNIFKQRMSSIEAYWTERRVKEKAAAEEIYKEQVDLENAEYQKRRREAYNQAEQLQKQADEAVENDKMSAKKRDKIVEEAWKEHASKEKLMAKEHNNNLVELEQKKTDKLKAVNSEYYQDALQELRDFQTAIANLESKQPVMNAWGIINLKETKKNYNELRASYSDLIKELQEKKKKLNDDFKNGLIDRNAYDSDIREIDRFAADLGEKLDAIGTNFGDFWQGVDRWLQEIGQTFNSIYSSLATITDNYYEGEIDKQEKFIEKYEEMLDKQREATQKYADSVESIEDELSNARGARRQHLIDQLNAEMAAQRASLAQEKQIEKEKEAAEKKKIELQNEQAKKKKKADEIQAYINALMAVSMAAVNQWPIPALPMIAMATAMGAAQVAAIKSQPTPTYESGGVIQGKSHAQGGVKVLGGRAEVEGGEFITNKYTTTRNVELLEFVNSKRRKLNIEDFIEFYSSNKVRTSVKASSPKAKFADGGMIPSLRNDIELGDRLIRAFEDYSERPSVVQVVDIIDKTQAVRETQVLAGLID